MLPLVTILALAVDPAAHEPPAEALRLATAETTERISLPAGAASARIQVLPLERRIRILVSPSIAAGIAARVVTTAGLLCPRSRIVRGGIELVCRSNRIDASLLRVKSAVYLDVSELRGLPWRPGHDGPPILTYERLLLAGERCPGRTPAARGECALAAGKWVEAARHYRRALGGRDKIAAELRLGDIALLAADPATAIGWYTRAKLGPYARMAMARLCEMSAECFTQRPTLDPRPDDLPEPLYADLTLRHARVQAFLENHGEAMAVLARSFDHDPRKGVCRNGGELACRRLVLAALLQGEGAALHAAVEIFLTLPDRDRGALLVDLHAAAAEAAAKLGAPVFGGNLLSAVSARVDAVDLENHLLRAAELYLEGQDGARARVIVEFARTRTTDLKGQRWASVRHGLTVAETRAAEARPDNEPVPAKDKDREAIELAAALALSAQVQQFVQDATPAEEPAGQAAKTKEGR